MQKTLELRKPAAAVMAGVAAIHLALAPEYFGEAAYLGVLFVLGGLAAAALAVRLWRSHHTPSWVLGALIAAGMGIGFVLSRTTGLPGFHESEWEPTGIVSLILEGGFLAAAVAALRARSGRLLLGRESV